MNAQPVTSMRCSVDARVVRRTTICREHVRIELLATQFPASAPGQFLQLLCREDTNNDAIIHDWPPDGFPSLAHAQFELESAFLRRPFSIADRWSATDGVHLQVISRAVGKGTRWLERLQVGDTLNITGPLGRGFRLPTTPRPTLLVGGGVGIPPLLYLARALVQANWPDVAGVLGATSRDLLAVPLTTEPSADGSPTSCVSWPGDAPYHAIITSDDGSVGLLGVVTDGLRRCRALRRPNQPRPLVLACGPDGMLRALARLTREWDWDCQLCIERPMGCGVGTCLSCVVRLRDPQRPEGWRWALACTDGPVFERDVLCEYV